MEIMGVQIRTIVRDNVARRCDGCLEIIEGTPWRINLLDTVTAEKPVDWTERPVINPGPFQFHGDADHVRRWMAARGYLFCRRGEVREIMRAAGRTASDGTTDALARLTSRERDVLGCVARGLSNRAIADELGMAERTARTHVSNILAKLGLSSRTQAALFAVEHGLDRAP